MADRDQCVTALHIPGTVFRTDIRVQFLLGELSRRAPGCVKHDESQDSYFVDMTSGKPDFVEIRGGG